MANRAARIALWMLLLAALLFAIGMLFDPPPYRPVTTEDQP